MDLSDGIGGVCSWPSVDMGGRLNLNVIRLVFYCIEALSRHIHIQPPRQERQSNPGERPGAFFGESPITMQTAT